MTLMILSALLISLFASLLLMFNPFSTALVILMIALTSAALFAITISSWYAFLIFLIYVGGMLVMFAYFIALTPNQFISSPDNTLPIVIPVTALMLMAITFMLPKPTVTFSSFSIQTMYSQINIPLLIIIALILLLTMIFIVKITCRSKGPLRAFMAYV